MHVFTKLTTEVVTMGYIIFCTQENEQRRIMEEKKLKRELQKQADLARRASAAAKKGMAVEPPPEEEQGCIVDKLLQEIREGTTLRSTKRKTIRRSDQLNNDDIKKLKEIASKSEQAVNSKRTSVDDLKKALKEADANKETEEIQKQNPIATSPSHANNIPSIELISTPSPDKKTVDVSPTHDTPPVVNSTTPTNEVSKEQVSVKKLTKDGSLDVSKPQSALSSSESSSSLKMLLQNETPSNEISEEPQASVNKLKEDKSLDVSKPQCALSSSESTSSLKSPTHTTPNKIELETTDEESTSEPLSTNVPPIVPQEVPTSVPQEVSTNIPPTVPQEVPTNVPQEVPTSIPQEIPTNVLQEVPTNVLQEVPTSVPQEVPTNVLQEVPTWEVPTSVPQEVPISVPQEVPRPTNVPLTQDVSTNNANNIPTTDSNSVDPIPSLSISVASPTRNEESLKPKEDTTHLNVATTTDDSISVSSDAPEASAEAVDRILQRLYKFKVQTGIKTVSEIALLVVPNVGEELRDQKTKPVNKKRKKLKVHKQKKSKSNHKSSMNA